MINSNALKPSPTSTGDSSSKPNTTATTKALIPWKLPRSWERGLSVRQWITCQLCYKRPGPHIPQHQRWKWLTEHMVAEHKLQRSERPATLHRIK